MAEALRPRYHFAPQRHWINDPNGLVWFDGEYHLFFQHNPCGDTWGHMSWGHAVSRDLLHWQELPLAIPEGDGYMIFSGSVVVDHANTAGFAAPGQTALVAVWTGATLGPLQVQNQQLSWSVDRGRSWTRYSGNPVLDPGLQDFRDPKVFWHAASARWVMVVVRSDLRRASFYASQDLKAWSHLSDFGPTHPGDGIWECPDLFPLTLPASGGAAQRTVWVFKVDIFENHVAGGSGSRVYFGEFDGTAFRCLPYAHQWTDWGMDFYACASWNHLPVQGADPLLAAEALWLGWLDSHRYANELPTSPWRGQMSIPRQLCLRARNGKLELLQQPVGSLVTLRRTLVRLEKLQLSPGSRRTVDLGAHHDLRALDIELTLRPAGKGRCGLALRCGAGQRTEVGHDADDGSLYVDRSQSGLAPADPAWARTVRAPCALDEDGLLRLRVLLDSSSVEVLTCDGSTWLSQRILPREAGTALELLSSVDQAEVRELVVHALEP